MIFGRLARFAARRVASSPKARAMAAAAAREVAAEAKTVAREKDKLGAAKASATRFAGRLKGAASGPKSDGA